MKQAARDDVRPVVEDAARELQQAALRGTAAGAGASVLTRVRKTRTYGHARQVAEEEAAQLATLAKIVASLGTRLRELQSRQLEADPFGDAWRDIVRRKWVDAGPDSERLTVWIPHYAKAFVAGHFEACIWLSESEDVRPDVALAVRMLASAHAAADGNIADAVPALETLTEASVKDALSPEVLLRCWCMLARAVARGLGDPARARDVVTEVLGAASPRQPASDLALLHTVLGECHLACDDPGAAAREAKLALRLGRAEPSAHVLRGLVAETIGNHGRAYEFYDDAVAIAGERAVSGELFAPVPAGLLWRYGRRFREKDPPRAADAIMRAIDGGIRGSGDYPERKAYVDLARALRASDNQPAAARAFWEAGRRYSWVGDEPTATSYLAQACKLDPPVALYQFEYAEGLRILSVHDDGTVDLRVLENATKAWRAGMGLRVPGRDISWAYITGALIVHEESGDLYRPRVSWRAALLLERGCMATPDDVRMTAQLSQAHRLLGNRRAAFALTQQALAAGVKDEIIFDQHLLALIELGRAQEALGLLGKRRLTPERPWLVTRKVQLLLELNRPQEALNLLDSTPPSDPSLHDLQVALCHRLLGQTAQAHEAYQRVWDRLSEREVKPRTLLAGRAGYLLCRYDDAAEIYTKLVTADPLDATLACDLAQVLLARGRSDTDDLAKGAESLRAGVATTRSAYALSQLDGVELPLLLAKVEGEPHAGAVAETVASAKERIRGKLRELDAVATAQQELERELGQAGDAADSQNARQTTLAGLARTSATDGRWEEALGHYATLATDADVPEALQSAENAAKQVCSVADRLTQSDPAAAVRAYDTALQQLERTPSASRRLIAAMHLRAALIGARLESQLGFAGHLTASLSQDLPDGTAPDVQEALAAAVLEPDHYWQVVDAAGSLAASPRATADERAAAERLLSRLDLSVVLRTRQNDVDASRLFALATPLVLRLGPGLFSKGAQAGPLLDEDLSQIRERVERDTGVRIPGVSVRAAPEDDDPGAYEIELYEVVLARGSVPVDSTFVSDPVGGGRQLEGTVAVDPLSGLPGRWVDGLHEPADGDRACLPAEFVARHLEAVIRTNLGRLFSIDDVGLWLSSISSPTADVDRLTRSDRLELLRLLRLLLREQVPIVDHEKIFEVVRRAEPGWSAVDLLPAARRGIVGRLAAPYPVGERTISVLPKDLENDLGAGLAPTEAGVWRLPRDKASALTARLAVWYRDSAKGATVVVRGPALRPFVWRLLAGLERLPVHVIADEELDDGT